MHDERTELKRRYELRLDEAASRGGAALYEFFRREHPTVPAIQIQRMVDEYAAHRR